MPIVDSVDFFKEFLFGFTRLDFTLSTLFRFNKKMGSVSPTENPETNPPSTKKGVST